jgi:hypothetical protein
VAIDDEGDVHSVPLRVPRLDPRGGELSGTRQRGNDDGRLHRQQNRKRPRGYARPMGEQKCAPFLRRRKSFKPSGGIHRFN